MGRCKPSKSGKVEKGERLRFNFLFFLLGHMTTRLNTHDSLRFSSSPPSPSPSLDYSIVSHPSPSPDRDATLYASHPARSQPYLCTTRYSGSSSKDRDKRTNTLRSSSSSYHLAAGSNRAPQTGKSMKFLLPRLWGALSSPTRKARRQTARRKPYTLPSNISYADLQPLDGEEGELIDEACYVERYDSAQSPRNLIGPWFDPFSRVFLKTHTLSSLQTSYPTSRLRSPSISCAFSIFRP